MQRKPTVAEQEIISIPKCIFLMAVRAKKAKEKTARTQLPNLLGVDIKLPLPSTPSLEFLIPPGVRLGVFSL